MVGHHPEERNAAAGGPRGLEGTLGGPILKDHLWFFGAGRSQKVSTAAQTSSPASVPYTFGDDEKRYEGKLTITPFQNHTITGSYIRIDRDQANYGFTTLPFYDLASIYDRQLPQELYTANYNGVLTDKLFVEAQYSKRKFTFENSGSRYTDLIQGTPFYDQTRGGFYNSPIFCAACPGSAEKRDNEDVLAKATYFLSTPSLGSHSIVLGFDDFAGSRLSNNYQSGSAYFFNTTTAIFRGGDIYPMVDSGSYLGYYPIPNVAQPSDVRTYSVFLNDQWRLASWSFNVGVRWDKNHAKDSKGAVTANDDALSPRLAAAYDVSGKGTLKLSASYARYVGAIQETQVGAASSFGAPAAYLYYYTGPGMNLDPGASTLLTRAQVLQQMFSWFGITAPGQFPSQHADDLFYVSVPGVNAQIRESLKSPHTDEFAVGVSGALGRNLNWRVDGIYRKAADFYSIRTDTTTGTVKDSLGNSYDLGLVENHTDPLERKYYGLNMQASYRFGALNVGGNWTWSHTYGNFVGETTGSGPVQATLFQYPEYKQASWNNPTGDLSQDQRHRVRLYGTYDVPLPKAFGNLSVGLIQSYDSGLPYGAAGKVRSARYVTNPGYLQPPPNVAYYFTARDEYRTPSVKRTDLSLNYSHDIGPVQVFVIPQVVNVFNLQSWVSTDPSLLNTSVQDRTNNSALADFNPFTEKPVEGVNWKKGSLFGRPTSINSYQQPRTFRVSVGVRF